MTRWANALTGIVLALPPTLAAQGPAVPARPAPAVRVTLAEALEQARRNSPAYRQILNDAGPANWGVRNAYAALAPTMDVSGSTGYTGSGSSTFGGSTFNQTSPSLTSAYALSFNWRFSGAELAATGQQKAARRATLADITNAGEQLRSDITVQYLSTLQATAQTEVARQQVARNADFLALARAKHGVGQTTMLDVRQAEVQKGQSDVALLRARQSESEAKLELFRRIGLSIPADPEAVALADSFAVVEPQYDVQQLVARGKEENPSLLALSARERSAAWNVRSAKSRFFPTVFASAGLRGFTQEFTNESLLLNGRINSAQTVADNCRFQNALIGSLPGGGVAGFPNGGRIADCNDFAGLDATGDALDPTVKSGLLSRNNVFPFRFTKQPFSASLTISLPIFDGFSRNLQVAQARAQQEDAEEGVRARRLQVETEIRARYLSVQTAYRTIVVQDQNRQAAREQLRLAQERYRLGNGSSLEVADGENSVTRAEGDYVNAIYEYHKAVAQLEFAVGRPLR